MCYKISLLSQNMLFIRAFVSSKCHRGAVVKLNSPCKPGVVCLTPGFSSLSDEMFRLRMALDLGGM